ncbi:MAG: regulatory iron-sulfur-containing complex subunit RicT [Candidatus Saganbacteria bacterium]|nr:regulatory iron-sulfur-containing complex subunit RicT [Candidatus Saganbacteria bacterium]
MNKGLGVKFRKFNNISPLKGYKQESLKIGAPVIVETDRGTEYGWIVVIKGDKGRHAGTDIKLRKVLRYADEKDTAKADMLAKKEKELFCQACSRITTNHIPIKLLNAEIMFDESRMILYYKITDAKKNFQTKDVIKELSGLFGMRIEMHMISARDEARIFSGFGICGRSLCCSTFLEDFPHVTVKILKEQGIAMNPSKVCGICGKLLCCLKYEYEGKE